MIKDFRLKSSLNNFLDITAYGINNISSAPCLIFVHGFKGFKDWGFVPYLAKYFANEGYFVLTFNFSHNGIGSNKFELSDMDKFARNTVSLEISELSDIINAYCSGFFGSGKNNKIGIIGHSRGGAVALLSSFSNNNVNAYSVWGSVDKLDRYTERQKREWRDKGFIEVINSRTNQMMRVNLEVLEDIERIIKSNYNIEMAVRKLNKPLLIVHGEQDLTVPIAEAEMIYERCNKELTKFIKIPNAGHTFDIVHPFENSNYKFDLVLNETKNFFNSIFLN
jgi:pimeloyl-ACP methyl ester carboxylesterase